MSGVSEEAANIILPLLNIATTQQTQAVVATSTSSARTDLGALLTALLKGHFLTITNDGASGEDVYIAFNTADAGAIDETATGAGATICQVIKAGQSLSGRLPAVDSGAAYQWLIHKALSGTPKLRIHISSVGSGHSDVRELRA